MGQKAFLKKGFADTIIAKASGFSSFI